MPPSENTFGKPYKWIFGKGSSWLGFIPDCDQTSNIVILSVAQHLNREIRNEAGLGSE